MINFFELLQYGFVVRGLLAGLIIAVIAPVVGIFLVLRRYSLIADTLAHVSLAGVAVGLLTGISPLLTALGATLLGSFGLEQIRAAKKIPAESVMSLLLSASLAVAVVLISLSDGFSVSLFNYLFGSIATVTVTDVWLMLGLGIGMLVVMSLLFRHLVFIAFDEEAAKVSGLPVRLYNTVFILLAALAISLAIPVVGVLLISALMIIPVLAALQFQRSLLPTLLIAQLISIIGVVVGFFSSFILDLAPGGTIVLLIVLIFALSSLWTRRK